MDWSGQVSRVHDPALLDKEEPVQSPKVPWVFTQSMYLCPAPSAATADCGSQQTPFKVVEEHEENTLQFSHADMGFCPKGTVSKCMYSVHLCCYECASLFQIVFKII